MRHRTRAAAAVVTIGFLALHVPYLPASLEDLDSINFALGVRRYDVAQHQPHPPGYPVFIALARVFRQGTTSEAHALGALGIVAGALGVIALFALFQALEVIVAGRTIHRSAPTNVTADLPVPETRVAFDDPDARRARWVAWASALVAATSPLYWFTAVRPLSDATGLTAALGVQAWTLIARTPASFSGAAFAAGLAAGLRSQVAWLTVPLVAFVAFHRAHARTNAPESWGIIRLALVSSWSWLWPFAIGCVVWAVPMVIVTGGPAAYWHALFRQGAEDLSGIQMLWTMPTPRVFVSALYHAFVAPWALWSIAVVVLVFATVGAALMARYWRAAGVTLAVAFVPYLLFDLVFQETFTTRYALPLVVPMAYLAVRGAAAFGWRAGLLVAIALSTYDAHIGGTSVAGFARQKAPAFRMLDDMARAQQLTASGPVLAMDRREQLDLRRPMVWVGEQMPRVAQRLPSPPQHEWLELVKYWNSGGRSPVWFVADPLRTDIDLVQHDDPSAYRWSVPYPVLLGGVRPNEMDWYRIERPTWYVGAGWALTPESAGVSQLDHKGLANGPIEGWVHRSVLGGGAIAFGGRNFDPTGRPRVTVTLGSLKWAEFTVNPGFFLQVGRLPFVDGDSSVPEYMRVTVASDPPAPVAIEQFDATAQRSGRVVFGYGAGWNEQEYNPTTGKRWRWLSERGEIQLLGDGRPVRLHLEGESPRKYFSKPSRLTVKIGSAVAFDDAMSADFAIDVTLPAEFFPDITRSTTIVLETDQVYVPAERSSRSPDRRHLGLRIFKCELHALAR